MLEKLRFKPNQSEFNSRVEKVLAAVKNGEPMPKDEIEDLLEIATHLDKMDRGLLNLPLLGTKPIDIPTVNEIAIIVPSKEQTIYHDSAFYLSDAFSWNIEREYITQKVMLVPRLLSKDEAIPV